MLRNPQELPREVSSVEFGAGNMYDYGARFYDPSLGRFTGVDPLADWAPGWTPYRYAFNNPLNYTDPFGLFESRAAARDYKREHDVRGRIKRQGDGTFAIENRKDHSFTQDFGGDIGIQTGALVVERGVHLRDIGLDGFNVLSDPYSESYNPNAVVFTDAADIAYAFGSYLGLASPSLKPLSVSNTGSTMMAAARTPSKNGLTVAGRSLQKHGSRVGSSFPKAQGNPAVINEQYPSDQLHKLSWSDFHIAW